MEGHEPGDGRPGRKGPKTSREACVEEGEKMCIRDSPCVVKPCGCGSSVGVSIVENEQEWEQALSEAGKYGEDVLAEEYVAGREFSVGILDGKALPAIEIVPKQGFYDYTNKYQAGIDRKSTRLNSSHRL